MVSEVETRIGAVKTGLVPVGDEPSTVKWMREPGSATSVTVGVVL